MNQFDPNIPGLMQGDVVSVALTEPQPFPYGVGNHIIDPTKPFKIAVEWELFGALVPLWLAALKGEWDVSVYAESLGEGPEIRLATAKVLTTATLPCTVNTNTPTCTKFAAVLTVPANVGLVEHTPDTDQSGIYKLVVSVFLNSDLGLPGFDLIGFQEGPIIQVERPI